MKIIFHHKYYNSDYSHDPAAAPGRLDWIMKAIEKNRSDYQIITPLEVQIWRERRIVPKAKYQYPPSVANPFELKIDKFYNLLQSTEKDIVRFLAVDLSFSGLYAEEICARAGVDKKKLCRMLSKDEVKEEYHLCILLLPRFPQPN